MSHIHIPDGVLPIWLWVSGYALTILLISILWRWGKAAIEPHKFALLGIFASIMVLVSMIEIPPFAYHINLSIVTVIVLGPQSAVLAALMVNIILALVGHGGITIIGINTLIISIEMIAGYYMYQLLRRFRISLFKSGFIATVTGLIAGSFSSFIVIAIGSPWINRFLQNANGEHELGPGIEGTQINLYRMAMIMLITGLAGWTIEAILSASILEYLGKVYPGLVKYRKDQS